jgi:hypothetical protein
MTMSNYLFIESRPDFDAGRERFGAALAGALSREGARVTTLLVQNGVLCARRGARAPGVDALLAAGVAVLADDFSLRERAIPVERLRHGIEPSSLGVVIDRLLDGWHVIWH